MKKVDVKKIVKEGYAKIAKGESSCCNPVKTCCGTNVSPRQISKNIGYSEKEMSAVPDGANLGLGCGNPVALASLKEGDVVLDLGSGAGFDAFLAAKRVGDNGKVIGVDMTPEMVKKATANAQKGKYKNVEFRLGEIENLPVANDSIDAVISNCVINLSPDKKKVFAETFRVLKPGGRLMVSDIVTLKELPPAIKKSIAGYLGCLSGALMKDEYIDVIKSAGFDDVKIIDEASFPVDYMANDPTAQAIIGDLKVSHEEVKEAARAVVSIKISAVK